MGLEITWLGVTARDAVLNVATLGISDLRDEIYREVARGIYDRTGNFFLSIIAGFLGCLLAGAALAPFVRTSPKKAEQQPAPRTPWWELVLAIVAVLIGLLLPLAMIVRIYFANNASATAEQYLTIVTPYVDEVQVKEWRSRMAQTDTADDFLSVIKAIDTTARQHGAVLPDFEWF